MSTASTEAPCDCAFEGRTPVSSVTTERGCFHIYELPPNILLTVASGREGSLSGAGSSAVEVMTRIVEEQGSILMFGDWERLEQYDSEARKMWTTWVKDNHQRVQGGHYLVSSSVVAMGINVASMALQLVTPIKLQAYTDRDEWAAALAEARGD